MSGARLLLFLLAFSTHVLFVGADGSIISRAIYKQYEGCQNPCAFFLNVGGCLAIERQIRRNELACHMPGDVEFFTFLSLHRRLEVLTLEDWYTPVAQCVDLDGLRALERIEAVRVATDLLTETAYLGGWSVGAMIMDTCSAAYPVIGDGTTYDQIIDSYSSSCGDGRGVDCARGPTDPVPAMRWNETESDNRTSNVNASWHEEVHRFSRLYPTHPLGNNVSIQCFRYPINPDRFPAGSREISIGPTSSESAEKMSTYLGTYNPFMQLSYGAESPKLNNRDQYPTFFRTAPQVSYQADAVAAVVKTLSWSHIGVFASNDDYGNSILERLQQLNEAADADERLCLALSGTFAKDDREGITTLVRNAMELELKHILLLSSEEHALEFLHIAAKNGLASSQWLGTYKWTAFIPILHNSELAKILGDRVLSISPMPPKNSYVARHWPRIKRTLLHRLHHSMPTVYHMAYNPWLKVIWEKQFDCVITKEMLDEESGHDDVVNIPTHFESFVCRLWHTMQSNKNVTGRTICAPGNRLKNALFLFDEGTHGCALLLCCS